MFCIVSMYGKSDQKLASVCVEVEKLIDAHASAIEYMKSQNPNFVNLTFAEQIFSIVPFSIRSQAASAEV